MEKNNDIHPHNGTQNIKVKENTNLECPLCNSLASNIETERPRENIDGFWYRNRKYRCKGEMHHEFYTKEEYRPAKPLYVQKNGNRIEPFEFDKLIRSIREASAGELTGKDCRKLAYQTMENLSRNDETTPTENGRRGKTFKTSVIGEGILNSMKKENYHKAMVRYALVFYKDKLGIMPDIEKIIELIEKKWRTT